VNARRHLPGQAEHLPFGTAEKRTCGQVQYRHGPMVGFSTGWCQPNIVDDYDASMNVFDFTVPDATGTDVPLERFRGQVLLIVNVASRCGFTRQYAGLESLYRQFKDRGFTILGFPCNQFLFQEPGSNEAIQQFCKLKYDVSFPVFGKIKVNGSQSHPLYRHLKAARRGFLGLRMIEWNFTKFLTDRQGHVVDRFSMFKKPESLAGRIEALVSAG
jgi:glutathione peroxidase